MLESNYSLHRRLAGKLTASRLLSVHVLRTLAGQGMRSAVVLVAVAGALGVIIGLFAFVSSIDDSFRERGEAVQGVADAQVQAVAHTNLPKDLWRRLERVKGTDHAIALSEQRIQVVSKKRSVPATAYGIDRRARLLKSAMERELKVKTPKNAENGGLSISRRMATRLGVKKGDKVRVFAYQRTPKIKVSRVIDVPHTLADVITLPRKSLERIRDSGNRPNRIYIQLEKGYSFARWEKNAKKVLPGGATVTTPARQQEELGYLLDIAVRSYTYVFGAVALTIAALLIYILQLMRMLERQEDTGLVRALGSGWGPMAVAEMVAVVMILVCSLPLGLLVGHLFADHLAGNLPTFLTEVFNFDFELRVKSSVVLLAAVISLALAAVATIGALAATRRPVADQLGRAPQAGATATARISMRAAAAMTIVGGAGIGGAFLLAGREMFLATAAVALLAVALVTPGITALAIGLITRRSEAGGRSSLVARSAVDAYQRRVAFSTAIMALGTTAVIPLVLADHGISERSERLLKAFSPSVQRIMANDDMFPGVPMRVDYARKPLDEPKPKRKPVKVTPMPGQTPAELARQRTAQLAAQRARELRRPLPKWASGSVIDFPAYGDRRVAMIAADPDAGRWVFQGKIGVAQASPTLRKHPNGIVITSQLAAWSNLDTGNRMKLATKDGIKSFRVAGVVEDLGWPVGSIYVHLDSYQRHFSDRIVSQITVKPGDHIRRDELKDMSPVHTIDGAEFDRRVHTQVNMTRENILAMRLLAVIASLIAIAGIFATSVFARRREWGVLRAMGMSNVGLIRALVLEIALVLGIGLICGVAGGLAFYELPIRMFMESQGLPITGELVFWPIVGTAGIAISVGMAAVLLPAILVARSKLTDALAYE